jgi:hypothetical protein
MSFNTSIERELLPDTLEDSKCDHFREQGKVPKDRIIPLITLLVITISSFHCIPNSNLLKIPKKLSHEKLVNKNEFVLVLEVSISVLRF